jgi:hypothetical protein
MIGNGATAEDFTEFDGRDETLAKNIAEVLDKKYPGHLWGVNVDGRNGVAQIMNLALSGRWGFIVKLREIDTEYKVIMRAGGELLERYNLSRGRLDEQEYQLLERDVFGNLKVEK